MVRKCPLAPIWRISTRFSPHLPWLLNDECVWRMIYPLYLCGPAIKETKINLVNQGQSFVCDSYTKAFEIWIIIPVFTEIVVFDGE